MAPSWIGIGSGRPVTVIIWGIFQFNGENVTVAWTEPSVKSEEFKIKSTKPVGLEFITTEKEPSSPLSSVRLSIETIVNPTWSMSIISVGIEIFGRLL